MRPVVRVVTTLAVVGGSLVSFGARTFAATAVADLAATATVVNNCSITTAALAFGPYDPVVANVSTNLDGIQKAQVAYEAANDLWLNLPLNPTDTVGKTQRAWAADPLWAGLAFKPDGDIRGSYAIAIPGDARTLSSCAHFRGP